MDVGTLNYVLALGTIVLQVEVAVLTALLFLRDTKFSKRVAEFLGSYGLWLAFFVALSASALTLVYSEYFGYPPCPLCWWQRIFLYPQVVLFALAAWYHDTRIAVYSIALSVAGLAVALYHHALQVLPSGSLPCPAEGAVSCAQRFVFEFGYVTFPLMSATLFALLIVLMLYVRARARARF